eukprot:SAG11_NODE_9069_length_947_cov_1.297170_1_plen_176_part_00
MAEVSWGGGGPNQAIDVVVTRRNTLPTEQPGQEQPSGHSTDLNKHFLGIQIAVMKQTDGKWALPGAFATSLGEQMMQLKMLREGEKRHKLEQVAVQKVVEKDLLDRSRFANAPSSRKTELDLLFAKSRQVRRISQAISISLLFDLSLRSVRKKLENLKNYFLHADADLPWIFARC